MQHKHKSKILEDAKRQLEALKSIDPNMDFGDGVNLASLTALIEDLQTTVDKHNAIANVLNEQRTHLEHTRKDLESQVEQMLSDSPTLSDQETAFVQVNSHILEGVNLLEETKMILDLETQLLDNN